VPMAAPATVPVNVVATALAPAVSVNVPPR
jgi:hypothetical protein